MINKLKKINGFTLIETLVAVTVLMVAIVGPYTIASKGLQASLIAKDQDIAFNLAQDAVEYVRWVRDTNNLNGIAALSGFNGGANGHTTNSSGGVSGLCVSSDGSQSCNVDSMRDYEDACGAATCSTPLNYDQTSGFYTTASTIGSDTIVPTIFTRTVNITKCNVAPGTCSGNQNQAEWIILVTVSWSDQAGITRSINVREDLFNWQI